MGLEAVGLMGSLLDVRRLSHTWKKERKKENYY